MRRAMDWKRARNGIKSFKYILLIPSILCFILYLIKINTNNNDWCNIREEYPFNVNLESLRTGGNIHSKYFKRANWIENKYIHNPLEICLSHGIGILSLVKSSPGNFRSRMAIRKSWGQSASSHRNRLIFSLGRTSDLTHQIYVDREMEQYEDILQGTFQDTYKNLTLKTINSIQWTSRYCSSAKFVLFVDDDVIVNFKNLENFLWQLPLIEREQLLTGYAVTEYPSPNRFETKFALSLDEYRHPCFPPYISGPVVVTSGEMVKLFADAIPYVKPFVFEDVYLGIIVSKLGIKLSPVHNHLFDPNGSGAYNWSRIISSHQGKSMVFEAFKMIVSDLQFVTKKNNNNSKTMTI